MNKRLLYLVLLFSWQLGYSQSTATSKDFEKIRNECRNRLLSDTTYALEQSLWVTNDLVHNADAVGYFNQLSENGNWSDIDYSSVKLSIWKPAWHLHRLVLLAREYNKNHTSDYLQAIHRGLKYWITNDFKCPNWWQNQINVPCVYANLLLILDKEATNEEIAFLNTKLAPRVPRKNNTGQNKLWQHDIEARIALFNGNEVEFAKAIESVQSLVVVSTTEGIQPDYSFQQHGAMLQFGNYGLHYVNNIAFWSLLTNATRYDFSPDQKDIISNYCFQGISKSLYKGAMDIGAIGRQFRPECEVRRGKAIQQNLDLLKTLYMGNSKNQLNNTSFWRSDYMVQSKNQDYMFAVKMHGEFVQKVESINSENLKGSFVNDGACFIQRTGKEYRSIFPIWNWMQIPGTTCDTTKNSIACFNTNNNSDFVGQVSTGNEGIIAMKYNREGITANKAYFMVNDMLIALGAGICAPTMKNIVTTVNQRFTNEKAVHTSNNNQWIWHDSIAYIFPNKQEVSIKNELRSGNWKEINTELPSEIVTDSVVSISISHNHHDNYSYIIKPNVGLQEMSKQATLSDFNIVNNTKELQGIQIGQKSMFVCYAPTKIRITKRETILVDAPCMFIYSKLEKKIGVSDPTRKLNSIHITVNNVKYSVHLPKGDMAGSTVEMKLNTK